MNASTNNQTASAEFLSHPLVRNRYFFTIPQELWDLIVNPKLKGGVDPELAQLEIALGALCGDHAATAGLIRGRAFPYHHLHRAAFAELYASDMGGKINQAQLDRALSTASDRLDGFANNARGYLGWLLTRREFVNEHDALLRGHETVIQRWGTADFGAVVTPTGFESASVAEQSAFRTASSQFVEFFSRWRLQGLAAPYLPIPLQPLMAGYLPESILARYLQTGGVFVIPDTFPIPSRDEFRGMLESTLHGTPHEHLADWMVIVAGNNTGRQAIFRNARIFELQHFWRTLHHRHGKSLKRRSTLLKQAFAAYLKTGEQSIHQDLIEIRRRLGADWIEQRDGFSFGPF